MRWVCVGKLFKRRVQSFAFCGRGMRTSKLENWWPFVYKYRCDEKPVADVSCCLLEFLEVGRCFLHADVESANALCVRVLVRTFCLHVTFSLV